MKLLLDTQVVLWLSTDDARIPKPIRAQIIAPGASVLLSAIVLWEVAIKAALGKLTVDDGFYARIHNFDFTPLAVTGVHAWAVRHLPLLHRDPFDRLLVAQARLEGATIVSADARLPAYGVPVLWA